MSDASFFGSLNKPVIGMIHLLPLPGSEAYDGRGLGPVLERALADARILAECGVDAILMQNSGDLPAADDRPETIADMAMIGTLIRQEVKTPLGVNILANGTESALAVAQAVGATFVRIKVYLGAVVASSGIIQGTAQRALDFRRHIGATTIAIAADVYDRSSSPLGQMPIDEAAEQAVRHGKADALVIAGGSVEASLERARLVKARVAHRPVYAGGGTTKDNIADFLSVYDGVIVGKSIKVPQGPIDRGRLSTYMEAVARARQHAH